jgi:hypothetical protein
LAEDKENTMNANVNFPKFSRLLVFVLLAARLSLSLLHLGWQRDSRPMNAKPSAGHPSQAQPTIPRR